MSKQNKNKFGLGSIGYVDLSLNLMLGFAALFIILLMILKTETVTTTTNMDVRGHLVVKLTWNKGYDTDVDLWVKTDLNDEIISFKNRQGKVMYLDYDDTGSANDNIENNNIQIKIDETNQEILYIKLKAETRFVVNIHLYRINSNHPDCTVELISIDPNFRLIDSKQLTLTERGQEETVFIFYTDEDGKVTKVDLETKESFVYDFLSRTQSQEPGF